MLGGDLATVVFGLASALSWGAGDFSGGLATKRAPVFGVLAIGQMAGLLLLIMLALLGIWLVAGTGAVVGARDGLGLAVLAGCGFGIFFILVHRAGASAIFWPLVAARIGSLGLVLPIAIGRRQFPRPNQRLLVLVLLSGALDVAGNAFFVLAGQAGRLDVAAILAALYPASTVLLAAVLLGERVMRVQLIGIVAALAAIALIAS